MLSSCPFHDGNVGYLWTLQNSLVSAASQDKDPMRKPHDFLEIRADDNDGHAGFRQRRNCLVDCRPRARIWVGSSRMKTSARARSSERCDLLLISSGKITNQLLGFPFHAKALDSVTAKVSTLRGRMTPLQAVEVSSARLVATVCEDDTLRFPVFRHKEPSDRVAWCLDLTMRPSMAIEPN
jgi:hypothetical protein